MIKLTVIDRDDSQQEIEIPEGINLNLMEVLKASEYNILATCGGMALCATCHVQVLEGLDQLPEPEDAADALALAVAHANSIQFKDKLLCTNTSKAR